MKTMTCTQNAHDNNPNCQRTRKTPSVAKKKKQLRGIFDKFKCDIRIRIHTVRSVHNAQYSKGIRWKHTQNLNRIDEELNSCKNITTFSNIILKQWTKQLNNWTGWKMSHRRCNVITLSRISILSFYCR